jgi:hypothetical protein
VVIAVVMLALATIAVGPPAGAARPSRAFCYTSFSYGSRVAVGSSVRSGPSAPSEIGCTKVGPISRRNDTADARDGRSVVGYQVATTASTSAAPVRSRSSATVHGIALAGGVVTARLVRAESSTSFGAGGFQLSDAGTTFEGLRVRGKAIRGPVKPNTRINLPGVGYVILDQQGRSLRGSSASLRIDAIHLVVDQHNTLGMTGGTNVLLAHAMSGLAGPVVGLLEGGAYGSSYANGHTARSDRSVWNPMPCLGTRGVTITRSGADVNRGGMLSSGTARTTVVGTVNATGLSGSARAMVHSVALLGGIVSAATIRSVSSVAGTGPAFRFSAAGSSFGSLSVKGFPSVSRGVPANTRLTLPGIGILYLHRVFRTGHSIEVRMIELVVTHPNAFGMPVGSDTRIAVTKVAIR